MLHGTHDLIRHVELVDQLVRRLIGNEVEYRPMAADEDGFVGVRMAKEGGEFERVFHTDSWVCRNLVEMGSL
jgi:hypothetical protein